jgi:acyl-CoA oxidase
MSDDTSFIPDLPSGPLSEYRNRANFDWKKLRIFFEGENALRIKYMVWNRLEKDPLFRHSPVTLPVDEQKKLAAIQVKRVGEHKFLPEELNTADYKRKVWFSDIKLEFPNLQFNIF